MLMDYPLVSGIVVASSQLIHGSYDFNIELIFLYIYIYTYIHTYAKCFAIYAHMYNLKLYSVHT